ncbi:MAG: sulfotransferase [Gammaproteobacteria bacterium]|nr:sulfotransferase [Gammaproteobacteria bacterium]
MGLTAKLLRNERFFQDTWQYFRQRSLGFRIEAAPIFIVGCGHSGTSVLLRLLGAHSNIYGVPYESHVFTHPKIKQQLVSKIWNRNTVAQRKHRWVEKTPAHVRMINKIFASYPEARVLFVVRDGRDVAVSIRKRLGNFEKGILRWVDDNCDGLNWMDDPRVLKVRYEDLVKQYDESMRHICQFIGEAFEEGLVDYHEAPAYIFSKGVNNPGSGSGKDHKEYRNWQINQKLFDGSGKWVKEMTKEEKASFKADKEAMQMRINLGYTTDNDW